MGHIRKSNCALTPRVLAKMAACVRVRECVASTMTSFPPQCLKDLESGNTPYEECARCLVKFAVDNDLYDRMRKDLEHGKTIVPRAR